MLAETLNAVGDSIIALAGTPWVFLALLALATIDGFFPPVPSESVVIALATLAVHSGEPSLWGVAVVAAVGAFLGDQIAYSIGARIPVRTMRIMRSARAQRSIDWAERALAQRGASFIIGARYIPIGRVAVNMTAGSVGFSRRRFTVLAAIAAVSWSAYSVALGVGAGVWLESQPAWVAVLVGVVGGVCIGVVVDAVLKRAWGRRGRRAPAVPVPEDAGPVTDPGQALRPVVPAP